MPCSPIFFQFLPLKFFTTVVKRLSCPSFKENQKVSYDVLTEVRKLQRCKFKITRKKTIKSRKDVGSNFSISNLLYSSIFVFLLISYTLNTLQMKIYFKKLYEKQ